MHELALLLCNYIDIIFRLAQCICRNFFSLEGKDLVELLFSVGPVNGYVNCTS